MFFAWVLVGTFFLVWLAQVLLRHLPFLGRGECLKLFRHFVCVLPYWVNFFVVAHRKGGAARLLSGCCAAWFCGGQACSLSRLSAAWQEPQSSVPLIMLICLLLESLQICRGQGFFLAFIQAVLHGALIRTVSLAWSQGG